MRRPARHKLRVGRLIGTYQPVYVAEKRLGRRVIVMRGETQSSGIRNGAGHELAGACRIDVDKAASYRRQAIDRFEEFLLSVFGVNPIFDTEAIHVHEEYRRCHRGVWPCV